MAKKTKGNRVQVILECTEHKDSGMPGTSRYITTKNRKNTTEEGSKEGRAYTKVIKMVKSPKTGAYIFDEQMVANEKVQDFFKK